MIRVNDFNALDRVRDGIRNYICDSECLYVFMNIGSFFMYCRYCWLLMWPIPGVHRMPSWDVQSTVWFSFKPFVKEWGQWVEVILAAYSP